MKKVGFVYHPDFLKHRSESYHPENPQRLKAIINAIQHSDIADKLIEIAPEPAAKEDILLNHSEEYYEEVETSQQHEWGEFDADTYYCRDTFRTALLAAGGCIKAGGMVMENELDSAFCAVRPPGHHAEYGYAKGFCIFNNIAILARRLLEDHNLKRIAILDWDGHHGNGTQHAFYDSGAVHFTDLHAFPFYPGSGAAHEIGNGKGCGYTLNIPLAAGSGDEVFVGAVENVWTRAMDDFHPEIVLVSIGYDAYSFDPYVFLDVSPQAFNQVCRIAKETAEKHCGGKLVMVLEGGYVHDFQGQAVVEHLKILLE